MSINRLAPVLLTLCLIALVACVGEGGAENASMAPTVGITTPQIGVNLMSSQTPTPSFTSIVTETPTAGPSPTPKGLLGGRLADLLTDEVRQTEFSYGCSDFYVSIRRIKNSMAYGDGRKPNSYTIADIYVRDVRLLRSGCAGKSFSERWSGATVSKMTERYNAVIAVSGDYYTHRWQSFIVRNGELIQDIMGGTEVCVLYSDGTMEICEPEKYSISDVLAKKPWQVWCFGPGLLDENGRPKDNYRSNVNSSNPRCAIGYYEPGHYCLVVVEGRIKGASEGITLKELARLMSDLGCKLAYNLDGGGTAQMQWQGECVTRLKSGERIQSDIIYIAYLPEAKAADSEKRNDVK